jgi:hypothetical protein
MSSKAKWAQRPNDMCNFKNYVTVLCVTGLLLTAASCRHFSSAKFERDRLQCQRNQKSAGSTFRCYVDDHDGDYPRTIGEFYSDFGITNPESIYRMVRCPGFRASGSARGDVDSRLGYFFVDWSKWFSKTNPVPNDYPLIYDYQLSNHNGRGINVLVVDGSVFWDDGAHWLQDFARKHPDFKLQIPE